MISTLCHENSLVLFFASLVISIVLIFSGANVSLAMLMAFISYSIPVLGARVIDVVFETLNTSTLNILTSLIFAMILAELYRGLEVSKEVVRALEGLSPRIASIAIPMILGLLPMPGGAYVSAMMVDPIYDSMNLTPEEKTFINFWFRHVWISVWPLYQSVILASAILSMSVAEIARYTWTIALATIASGIAIVYPIFRRHSYSYRPTVRSGYRGVLHLWPFLFLAYLSLATPVPLPIAILVVISTMVTIYRPNRVEILRAIKYASDPTLITLILISLMFSNAIKLSNLTKALAKLFPNPTIVIIILIPFIIVMATGLEFTFSALAFPTILPLLNGVNITLAFLGGVLGSLLSPIHACLILSAKYFKAPLQKVYKYIIPAIVLTLTITLSITLTM